MARPVVATRVGCLPEFVVEGETGFLVEPDRPEDMAEKLLFLLEHGFEAQRMGEKGRILLSKNFSLDRFLSQTEEVYRKAILDSYG